MKYNTKFAKLKALPNIKFYQLSKKVSLGKTRAVLVFATERKNNVDPCLRSQTHVD